MDPGGQTHRVKFMIRDRSPDFTATSGAVLADAGSGPCFATPHAPRMNAITER